MHGFPSPLFKINAVLLRTALWPKLFYPSSFHSITKLKSWTQKRKFFHADFHILWLPLTKFHPDIPQLGGGRSLYLKVRYTVCEEAGLPWPRLRFTQCLRGHPVIEERRLSEMYNPVLVCRPLTATQKLKGETSTKSWGVCVCVCVQVHVTHKRGTHMLAFPHRELKRVFPKDLLAFSLDAYFPLFQNSKHPVWSVIRWIIYTLLWSWLEISQQKQSTEGTILFLSLLTKLNSCKLSKPLCLHFLVRIPPKNRAFFLTSCSYVNPVLFL